MRIALDRLYRISGAIAAAFLVVMLLLVIAQMIARWLETPVTGLTELAGYCMGATSFFGLSYAFRKQSHIRVTLVIGAMGSERRLAEIICTSIAMIISIALAAYAVKATVLSRQFVEVSQGQDAVPIWIPQIAMAVGTIMLAVSLVDTLLGLVFVKFDAAISDSSNPEGQ